MVATTIEPGISWARRLIGRVSRKITAAVATAHRIAKPILLKGWPLSALTRYRIDGDPPVLPSFPCEILVAEPSFPRFGYERVFRGEGRLSWRRPRHDRISLALRSGRLRHDDFGHRLGRFDGWHPRLTPRHRRLRRLAQP